MDPRQFHIWDFPTEKIKVKLTDKYRNRLFKILKSEIGGAYRLSRFFDYNRSSFSKWKLGKEFIRLSILYKMTNFLASKGYSEFKKESLEKNIYEIKSVGAPNNKAIINPILPLTEDERLVKLVAHIIADGYEGCKKGNSISRGDYCNKQPELIQDFKNCLTVFGNVPTTMWRNKIKEADIIFFPAIITYILKKIYNADNFLSKTSRVPKDILNSNNSNLKLNFLASYIDDEATVYDSNVKLECANKLLSEDIRKMFIDLDFDTSDIKNDRIYYLFKVFNMEKIKILPLVHNIKKESIIFNLERSKNNKIKRNHMETKNEILNLLKIRNYTAKDLSRNIGIHEQTLRRHLRELKSKNLIVRNQKFSELWSRRN